MKKKTIGQMKEMSRDVAGSIVRNEDTRRTSTERERDIIRKIAYSALYTYNGYIGAGYNADYLRGAAQALCDMAEYRVDDQIRGCNGYLTIYNPLKEIFRNWDADDITDDEWIPEF